MEAPENGEHFFDLPAVFWKGGHTFITTLREILNIVLQVDVDT